MIAFESLFLADNQELTYKLAIRVAFFLEERQDRRQTIIKDIKKSYGYRSKIVHGKHVSRVELRNIFFKNEEYLRQSLRKFLALLEQGHTLENLRKNLLDENIIQNGTLLTL